MKHYNTVFVTPCPSFYKVKMFNEIAKERQIFAIYTFDHDVVRDKSFYTEKETFRTAEVSGGALTRFASMYKYLSSITYSELVIDGWDTLDKVLLAFCFPRIKNACIVESSIYESSIHGFKAFIKKLFFRRMNRSYCSGKAQEKLVRALGYKREVVISGGCGLLNYIPQPLYIPRERVSNFIYVGRLIPEKNLELLIRVFNNFPKLVLNIIGYGVLESELKAIAHDNIHFIGQVDNQDLWKYYQENDVFVLPSVSETWGLVVEEALNNGLPIIVSDCVGCRDDFATENHGLVFQHDSEASLQEVIRKITDIEYYNKLRSEVAKMDFQQRAKDQINAFIH